MIVRKPAHARSAFLDDFLRSLRDEGFGGAPLTLGYDEQGRQLFEFVPGWVPYPMAPYRLPDAAVLSATALIRDFHDAGARSPLSGGAETVCHSDLGPHNTVFRDGRAIALIDFDADTGPGRRIDDFDQAVWSFADLLEPAVPWPDQARTVRLMCDAYPGMTPGLVIDALTARFERARADHAANGRIPAARVFEDLLHRVSDYGDRIRGWSPSA
ncbi:hypothetical protein ACQP2F_25280 [Actinoplanes sp. CA-030573]|uniref:hypothetical protein n=1 Tax=Actinoplanes sp. CA-030573 TaxID=3239898 RepID=UPI003D931E9A